MTANDSQREKSGLAGIAAAWGEPSHWPGTIGGPAMLRRSDRLPGVRAGMGDQLPTRGDADFEIVRIEELIKQIFVHLTVAEFVNRPILAVGREDFDRLGKHAFYIQDHDRPAKVRCIMLIARIGFEPDLRFL